MFFEQPMILIVAAATMLGWLLGLTVFVFWTFRHYRRLTKGITKKDLRSVLEKLLKDLNVGAEKTDQIVKELAGVKSDSVYTIQKIGLVRYNPFAETGGNQSFCLAILDGQDSGLVISSLHSRETTRVYAKPVKGGKAVGYEFSDEEKQAIKKAKKIK